MPRPRPSISTHEIVDTGDDRANMRLLLEHYLERVDAGDFVGIMVVAEPVVGTYECRMTATDDAARRLGRAGFLYDAILDTAREDA